MVNLDWSRVQKTPGCWLWMGSKAGQYGRFRQHGVDYAPHRVVYEEYYGEIPDGMVIDHLCNVKLCVNPQHLEAVPIGENAARGYASRNGQVVQRGDSVARRTLPLASTGKLGRPATGRSTRSIAFRLPNEQYAILETYAGERSVGQLVSYIMQEWMKNLGNHVAGD